MHSSLQELKYFVAKLRPYRIAANVIRPAGAVDEPGWDVSTMLRHFAGLGRPNSLNSIAATPNNCLIDEPVSAIAKLRHIYKNILGHKSTPPSLKSENYSDRKQQQQEQSLTPTKPAKRHIEELQHASNKTPVAEWKPSTISRRRVEELKRQLRNNQTPVFINLLN
jgi:hypothetical protein